MGLFFKCLPSKSWCKIHNAVQRDPTSPRVCAGVAVRYSARMITARAWDFRSRLKSHPCGGIRKMRMHRDEPSQAVLVSTLAFQCWPRFVHAVPGASTPGARGISKCFSETFGRHVTNHRLAPQPLGHQAADATGTPE